MDISTEVKKIAQKAREASIQVARLSSEVKERALRMMADGLVEKREFLLAENLKDLAICRKARALQGHGGPLGPYRGGDRGDSRGAAPGCPPARPGW